MKKLIVYCMVVLYATVLFAAGAVDSGEDFSLQKVTQKGQFVLGLDDSFPPMGFRNENQEIVGFDIDVAKEVCTRLGVTLVCQPIDWAAKESELNTGKIDCIWNGFTINEERKANLTFSDPYVKNAQVVVVTGDSAYRTLADLAGKQCGVQAGSSAEEALDGSADFKASLKQIIPFKDNLTALMDLEIGGLDAVVMDLLVANDNINRSGKNYRILDETLAPEEYGVGFRKNDKALASAVTDAMKAMAADGTMKRIAIQWFGADITIIGK